MKKLNRSFLKKFNAVLVALLALFGFSTCQPEENGGGELMMYGVPMPEFVVKGKITNAEDGKSIEGIRVTRGDLCVPMYGTPMPDFSEKFVLSDRNGNYFKFLNDTTSGVVLDFRDIDGEKNGLFRDTTIVVRFEDGKNVANFDIALTPKNKE